MKAYMLMTKSGPIVVLTSHTSILDTLLLEKLADKDIENFIAFPLDLAEQRYGAQTSARIAPDQNPEMLQADTEFTGIFNNVHVFCRIREWLQ